MTVKTILKEVSLFSLLPAQSLRELIRTGQTLSFEAGQLICEEGEHSDAMYVLLEGQIRVYKTDEAGNEVDISALGSGDFFGEMAMFDNKPRSATVGCTTACHLFMLDKEAFMSLLQHANTRTISSSFLSALVKCVRVIMEKYFDEDLAQRTLQAEMEAERHRSLA